MPWIFKKKKKDINDYYKNELLRSRMSDISVRTDEIIQQYFFVSKEEVLTLDEYLKIRELATTELELKKNNEKHLPISQTKRESAELPFVKEKFAMSEVESAFPEQEKSHQQKVADIANAAPEPQIKPVADETNKGIDLPFEDKALSESRPEPQKEQKESSFDFLAMLQSVED